MKRFREEIEYDFIGDLSGDIVAVNSGVEALVLAFLSLLARGIVAS